jgi:hypothetical protein
MNGDNDKIIRWGIIGCGSVTELKSLPARSKHVRSHLALAPLFRVGAGFHRLASCRC